MLGGLIVAPINFRWYEIHSHIRPSSPINYLALLNLSSFKVCLISNLHVHFTLTIVSIKHRKPQHRDVHTTTLQPQLQLQFEQYKIACLTWNRNVWPVTALLRWLGLFLNGRHTYYRVSSLLLRAYTYNTCAFIWNDPVHDVSNGCYFHENAPFDFDDFRVVSVQK